MQEFKTKVYDDYSAYFEKSEEKEMLKFLCVKDLDSQWIRGKMDGMQVVPFKTEPLFECDLIRVAEDAGLNASIEAIRSTGITEFQDLKEEKGYSLLKTEKQGSYLLSKEGYRSLVQRFGASCSLLYKLPLEEQVEFLNKAPKVSSGEVLMKVLDEKIRAVHGKNYKILPIGRLFAITREGLKKLKLKPSFCQGRYSHSKTEAIWELESLELVEKYRNLWSRIEAKYFDPSQIRGVIMFSSSDVGTSTATLTPMLKIAPKAYICIGKPLQLKHEGSASLEKYEEMVKQIYARFQESMEALEQLNDVPIKYTLNCIYNIGKEFGISLKSLTTVVEMYGTKNEKGTATDVFFLLQEAIADMEEKNDGKSTAQTENVKEYVARLTLTNFAWGQYDVPTTFQKW